MESTSIRIGTAVTISGYEYSPRRQEARSIEDRPLDFISMQDENGCSSRRRLQATSTRLGNWRPTIEIDSWNRDDCRL